jgi:aspartyl aminopeptidase
LNKYLKFIASKYETLELKLTQSFENKIWSSFQIGNLVQKELIKKQQSEYSKLRKYSEHLMNNNFNNIQSTLKEIKKSVNGYTVYRYNSSNKYIINLNLITNQIELKKSI